jgi:4-amino-4-deoxy-L-arabinose transferase-like glycosyltransferase
MKRPAALLVVIFAAAAPRLVAFFALGDRLLEPRQDQLLFAELAAGAASGRGLALDPARFAAKTAAWREPALAPWVREPGWVFGLIPVGRKTSAYEPLYPYTTAAFVRSGVPLWAAARAVNVIWGVAAAVAAYAAGWYLAGRRGALAAGLAAALYPAHIYYGFLAMGETAHLGLLALTVAAFYAAFASENAGAAIPFGLAGAAFFLTRAVGLPVFILLTGYGLVFFKTRGRAGVAAVAVATCAAALTPWLIRNAVVHGDLVVMPTRGGVNLWMRNNPRVLALEPGELGRARWQDIWRTLQRPDLLSYPDFGSAGEVERDRMLRARMSAFIRANPRYFAAMCGRRFVALVRPYGPQLKSPPAKAANVIPYGLAVIGGAWGFVVAARRGYARRAWPLLLVFLFYVAYHSVVHGGVRYRLPADVTLLILAGNVFTAAATPARRGFARRQEN